MQRITILSSDQGDRAPTKDTITGAKSQEQQRKIFGVGSGTEVRIRSIVPVVPQEGDGREVNQDPLEPEEGITNQ